MSRRERVLKSARRTSQPKREPRDLHRPTVELDLSVLERQTYLSPIEAAAYLRRPSVIALRRWVKRQGIPFCRVGRSQLFLRRDLDEAVQPPKVQLLRKKVS